MDREVLYEDDNEKVEKNDSQYDRFTWDDDDKSENRERHTHEWIDTYTTEQGYHGENTSSSDKSWSGKRWNNNK